MSGMEAGTYLANLTMMGTTYVDLFNNMIKRLFNWFFDLLDYKIVPNIHNGTNSSNMKWWSGDRFSDWYNKPMVNNGIMDVAAIGKDWNPLNAIIQPTPWYRDWSTLLYIAGGLVGVIGIASIALVGYSYYQILYPSNLPPPLPDNLPDGTNGVTQSILTFLYSIKEGTQRIMNPYNWWDSITSNFYSEAQQRVFRAAQNDINRTNHNLYPFTPIDPTASWFPRVKILMFGENNEEIIQRMRDRDYAWRQLAALAVDPNQGIQTPVSGIQTPGNVGLGLRFESSGVTEWIQASTSRMALESLPQTPKTNPAIILESIDGIAEDWASHRKPPMTGGDPRKLVAEYFKNPSRSVTPPRPLSPTTIFTDKEISVFNQD